MQSSANRARLIGNVSSGRLKVEITAPTKAQMKPIQRSRRVREAGAIITDPVRDMPGAISPFMTAPTLDSKYSLGLISSRFLLFASAKNSENAIYE